MRSFPSDSITRLMGAFRQGDREAGAALADLFYPELRRLAAAGMKAERSEHTWQPAALVHELYLELVKVKAFGTSGENAEEERAAFVRLAGHIMKRVLAHHARPLSRGLQRVVAEETSCPWLPAIKVCRMSKTLSRLAKIDTRLRSVVELKVFERMTNDEAARRLGCSRATVASCWSWAQRWLGEEWAGSRAG